MSTPLRHSRTLREDERYFEQAIRVIPGNPSEYGEQLAYLQELRARRGDRKFHRILVVGAGSGHFVQVALGLCAAADMLDSDTDVDLIESADRLWNACVSRLSGDERDAAHGEQVDIRILSPNATHDLRRSAHLRRKVFQVFELPVLEGPIRMAVEPLGSNYDLIIASHPEYCFPYPSATLAYFLASRCLKADGIAWFVVRDRDCGFFKLRENLLHEASLPDVNFNYFSDSFLDGICCLTDSHIAIRRIRRRTSLLLDFPERGSHVKAVKYLMGLDGLPADILSRIGEFQRDYSESHIWIEGAPQILQATGNESAALHALDAITRCLDMVRMISQDAQVLGVSLAAYIPSLNSEIPLGPDELLNLDEPFPFPEFRVREYGFAYQYPESEIEKQVIEEYERQHNSFVFYRRFFLDYYHSAKSYASLCRLGSLDRQPERREIFLGARARAEPRSKEQSADDFPAATGAWHNFLERYYCGPDSASKPDVWTISIGSRLLRTQARDLPLENDLPFAAGFFLTWATSKPFEDSDAAKFVGQIKTRLSQYLARDLFERFRQKSIELGRCQQLIANLLPPLQSLSKAAGDMHRDVGKLRAVLFDPAESLFDCYPQIAPFFTEGNAIRPSDWIPAIIIRPVPTAYNDSERSIIFAAVLCAIFGKQEELRSEKTVAALLAKAGNILADIEFSAAYEAVFQRLRFIIGGSEQLDLLRPNDWAPQVLDRALSRINKCLITPFKFETLEWPSLALQLAHQAPHVKGADLKGELREDRNVTIPPWTPIPYNAVIAFTLQFCSAWRSEKDASHRITALSHEHVTGADQEQVAFSIELSAKFVFGDDLRSENERTACFRDLLRNQGAAPRDWRIDPANFTDLRRPFIVLINRIAAFNAHPESEWKTGSGLRPKELFRIASNKNEFLIDIDQSQSGGAILRLVWRTANS